MSHGIPNRLDTVFAALRTRNEAALVTFVTAGDPWPDVERTARVILALAAAGADVIELGVPYSDPQADGPSIQASSQRALEGGVNPPFVLSVVCRVREQSQVPIVLMSYYNPILRMGLARFALDAANAGVDGFILTDLPPEEAGLWLEQANPLGLATIFLLAPTSNHERIVAVARSMSRGFVYCVSRTGVTGAGRDATGELPDLIGRIKSMTPFPVCIGFGISTAEHVARVARMADGAVIGSALVEFLHKNANSSDIVARVATMTAEWKAATRGAIDC